MRWVWKTSCTVCALAARAASTSPRAYSLRDSTLSSVPQTATSAPSPTAASGSVTGGQHVVRDATSWRSGARLLARLGDDDRQHVAGVRRAAADRDHHRPVLVDDADAQLAGDVGRGEHADHAAAAAAVRGVDADDVGAGVLGEVQRGVQHAGHADVVDVAAVAEGQFAGLVLGAGRRRPWRRAPAGTTCPWPRPRWRRGSSRSPCSGTGGRRGGGAIDVRSRSAPFLSICALARMTMPGMQNPHCSPPHAANASAKRWRSSASTPSSVMTCLPAILSSRGCS